MPTSSIRDQIAAKRAEVRSARNSPAAKPKSRTPVVYESFGSPARKGPQGDDLLEDRTVDGQVGRARRTGKLDLSSLDLPALPPVIYMDLLGIPESELSIPPVKETEEPKPKAPDADFATRLGRLDLSAAADDDAARRDAFGTPEPKKKWTEPEELLALKAPDNRIERLEIEIGLFGGLKTLDLRNNRLSQLPDAVADLLRLTHVDLSHNLFTNIPPQLLLIPDLESVNLCYNDIDKIDITSPVKPTDEGLAYGTGFMITIFERQDRAQKVILERLRSLNLSYNKLTVAGLTGLAGKGALGLRVLNLGHNKLTGVLEAEPAGLDMKRLPELASLILAGNPHLNNLQGDVAPSAAIDTEGCAWGETGGAATSLGASPRKSRQSTPEASAAAATYTPTPGGPDDVPSPTLTVPFITHAAATFDSEPLTLEMDVYLPPNADKPCPVVVWWHGGGLLQGNKENLPPHLRRLPSRDTKGEHFIVIAPNYRLAPQAAICDILADADAAVAYARTKLNDKVTAAGHKVQVDPSRVILSGGSAGGYLALMAGLPVPQSIPDADVGGHRGPAGYTPLAIAPFYPITDLQHAFWSTETNPVPWWGKSVPDSAARPHLNHRDPPVGFAVSGGPRSILYPYMLQHGLFPNLLFYNQRSRGVGLDSYRPSPETMSITTRLKYLAEKDTPRPPIYMVYGTIDDKIQPLEETVDLLKCTSGGEVVEVIEGADHAFDENPAEQCQGFYRWLESVL